VIREDQGSELRTSGQNPSESISFERTSYRWHPCSDAQLDLPPGFCLALEALSGRDRNRRFTPGPEGVLAFIIQASLAGHAILTRCRCIDSERRFSYHTMRLLYQLAPKLREHLGRSFHREQDLYVPRHGTLGEVGQSCLPPDIGLANGEMGRPWTPANLIEQGRVKASELGADTMDTPLCIRLGFLEAARRNPLDPGRLTEAEARQLVRAALFDLGPAEKVIDPPLADLVMERLLGALEKHCADDTDAFNRWLFETFDNVVHQISKRKCPIDRAIVRATILEAVFRAFTYVGDCVHQFAVDFRRAIIPELSPEECAFFDAVYLRQNHLGGLPLILLHDRFEFLREIILEIWQRPTDPQLTGVLLRMLHYYGEVARVRREGDRNYKKQRHHLNHEGRSAVVVPLDADRDAVPEASRDRFQKIVACLREKCRAACRCGTYLHHHAQLLEEETTDAVVAITDTCGECGDEAVLKVARAEFERIAWQVAIPERQDP
jgi:hypothetical protein